MARHGKIVNIWYVRDLLDRIMLEEMIGSKPLEVDVDSESDLSRLFSSLVLPYFQSLSASNQEKCRLTIAWMLAGRSDRLNVVLATMQETLLAPPQNPDAYLKVLWNTLFPDEKAEDVDTLDCIESTDVLGANEFREGRRW
ncbi:MAG: hypothetical protein L6R28_11845 [Planctomycetes bacterium]|nr:hypothetical protein [Planctomycetota bacterium]